MIVIDINSQLSVGSKKNMENPKRIKHLRESNGKTFLSTNLSHIKAHYVLFAVGRSRRTRVIN